MGFELDDSGAFHARLVGLIFVLLAVTAIPARRDPGGRRGRAAADRILTPGEALAGMSNEGMITVGVLFIVGAAVRETGGVEWIANRLFGRPKTPTTAVARMMLPTIGLSARS